MKLLVFLLILPAMLSFELQHPTEGSGGCFSGQPLHAYDKEIGDTTTECGLTQGYEAFWSSALVIENKIKNMTVQIVWSVPIAPGALELFLKNTSSDYVMVFMNNWVPDGPPRTSLVSVCLSGCDVTENPNKFVLEKSFAFKGNSSLSNYGQGFFDLAFGFDYATPPTKVESLTNVSITEDSVMLSWNASESTSGGWVERYLVWQDGINIANVSGLFFNVTGLVYDTDYEFTIGALDNFELYGENATPITVRIPSPKQPEVSPPTYSPPAPSFSGGGGGSFSSATPKTPEKTIPIPENLTVEILSPRDGEEISEDLVNLKANVTGQADCYSKLDEDTVNLFVEGGLASHTFLDLASGEHSLTIYCSNSVDSKSDSVKFTVKTKKETALPEQQEDNKMTAAATENGNFLYGLIPVFGLVVYLGFRRIKKPVTSSQTFLSEERTRKESQDPASESNHPSSQLKLDFEHT